MNQQTRIITLITVTILFITGCSTLKTNNKSLVFSVMGDVPRTDEEKIILLEQICKHNKTSSSQFIFHLGDIKSGSTTCDEDNYILVAEYLKQFNIPVFIVPGDNEWNDCEDPKQAWDYWSEYFNAFDQNWDSLIKVNRQMDYPVNLSFVKNDVLFIALNLVGGRIHDQSEWDTMQQNAANWIEEQFVNKKIKATVILAQANLDDKHTLFTSRFLKLVQKFKKPVLFVHGDGHMWLHDDPWIIPNLKRVQVDKGGIADPLEITIFGYKNNKFKFDRNPFKEKDIYINNR